MDTWQWCDCGALDALVDGNGNRTRWERDVQGRVTREIRADEISDISYSYDVSGRLKTITDPKDQVTTHTYNIDDSLNGTTYTNAAITTPAVAYTYDPYYARVLTMVDGFGTTNYTYKVVGVNGAGQVSTIDGPFSSDTIAYTYDELGRMIQRTINGSANQVDWTFDALGRVTSEENVLGEFNYSYDGVTHRIASVTYPNGQTSAYLYFGDQYDHRLQTIHHRYANASTLSRFDYTYDKVGNILTWRQQADNSAVEWEYSYDAADQLLSGVKQSTATPPTIFQRFAYSYDAAGNRTIDQVDDAVQLSTYDSLNRLISRNPGGTMIVSGSLDEPGTVTIDGARASVDANNVFRGTVQTSVGTRTFTIVAADATGNQTSKTFEVDVAGAGTNFSYDANGNLLSDGTSTFTWDANDGLVTANAGTRQLVFGRTGLRAVGSLAIYDDAVLTSSVNFVECGLLQPCEGRSSSGAVDRFFTIATQHAAAAGFEFIDHLGSLAAVAGDSGAVVARTEYDPFGSVISSTGSIPSRGYAGLVNLPIANLSQSRFRVYSSGLARFISEDPIRLRGGLNLYQYALNDPIRNRDPLGLSAVTAALTAGAMAGFVGFNGSVGGSLDSSGRLCGQFSVCARLGFGYFVSAGGAVGGTIGPNGAGNGWDCTIGAGGDMGAGPGVGGSFGVGPGGTSISRGSRRGATYGFGAGVEVCCSKSVVCCNIW